MHEIEQRLDQLGMTQLLHSFRCFCPSAHIAGGVLRDLHNGRPFKDVDIFVDHDELVPAAITEIRELFPRLAKDSHMQYDKCGNGAMRERQYEKDGGEFTVNLIELAQPLTVKENLERFDLGICKIGFNGQQIIYTPEYLADVWAKKITLHKVPTPASFAHSLKRYQRISAKYDWPLVIPHKLRDYCYPIDTNWEG